MIQTIKLTLELFWSGFAETMYIPVGIYRLQTALKNSKTEHSSPGTRSSSKQEQSEGGSTPTMLSKRRAERAKQARERTSPIREPSILSCIVQCCIYNGLLFWSSYLFFFWVFPFFLQKMTLIVNTAENNKLFWDRWNSIFEKTVHILWFSPLWLISLCINCFWFQDIATIAYRQSRGRPQPFVNIGRMVADVIFSVFLQMLFVCQASLAYTVLSLLERPWLSEIANLLHYSLLYSLYAFEYKWYYQGWEVQKRISYVEVNWPYFVGFGLPLALITMSATSSFFARGSIYAVLFPLLIVGANEAKGPQSSQFNLRFRLFAFPITVNNAAFKHMNKMSRYIQSTAANTTQKN